jgi:hypothetical protein
MKTLANWVYLMSILLEKWETYGHRRYHTDILAKCHCLHFNVSAQYQALPQPAQFLWTLSHSTVLKVLRLKRQLCVQHVTKQVARKFLNPPVSLGTFFPRYQWHKGAYSGAVIYAEGKDNTVPSFLWKRNSWNVNRWGLTQELMTPLGTTRDRQKCQKC